MWTGMLRSASVMKDGHLKSIEDIDDVLKNDLK
jgi:hypothetical protein